MRRGLASAPPRQSLNLSTRSSLDADFASASKGQDGSLQTRQQSEIFCSTPSQSRTARILLSLSSFGIWQLLLVTGLLGASRITSNYRNFRGAIDLWSALGDAILLNTISSTAKALNSVPKDWSRKEWWCSISRRCQSATDQGVVVCTGGDWYHFPSHFHLPENTRLAFVRDDFSGQLPQYFPPGPWITPEIVRTKSTEKVTSKGSTEKHGFSVFGTRANPLQPFNDLNMEEKDRYERAFLGDPLSSCDYVVLVQPDSRHVGNDGDGGANSSLLQALMASSRSKNQFEMVAEAPLLDSERSPSLTRALYIPWMSQKWNQQKYYRAYRRRIYG